MNDKEVMAQLSEDTQKVVAHFEDELKKLRTGRAHPSMVEDLIAEAYGTPMPLKQLATITTPEPQLIQISPFDPSNVAAIAQSIRANESLGFNPVDDGRVVRIQIPPLNEERRMQIVKQLGEKKEEAFVSLRKSRHEAMDVIDKAKKDKAIGEDDAKRQQQDVDAKINDTKASIEQISKTKEQDIMKV
ncbi:ribosome recycling factor [Candidatus Saccharibacteria bacterium]|nr:ribosome recycling factor [Candidatus Saccharibacteria bacterium]MCA9328740.1 ribosome recycling factor [Candidatus Saccharibacteria bacterium]